MPSARAAATPGATWSSSSVPKRPFSPQCGLMPGHRDPRRRRSPCAAGAGARCGSVSSTRSGVRPLDRGAQRHVRRDVDDVQSLRGEQHPGGAAAGQMREQPGVAVVVVAGRIQRLLVDRRGHDARGAAVLRELDRGADVLEGGLAAARAEHAEPVGKPVDRHVDQRHSTGRALPRRRERERDTARRDRAPEHRPIADDGEALPLRRAERRQGLDGHLGSDAGGVAHGDDDRGIRLQRHSFGRLPQFVPNRRSQVSIR